MTQRRRTDVAYYTREPLPGISLVSVPNQQEAWGSGSRFILRGSGHGLVVISAAKDSLLYPDAPVRFDLQWGDEFGPMDDAETIVAASHLFVGHASFDAGAPNEPCYLYYYIVKDLPTSGYLYVSPHDDVLTSYASMYVTRLVGLVSIGPAHGYTHDLESVHVFESQTDGFERGIWLFMGVVAGDRKEDDDTLLNTEPQRLTWGADPPLDMGIDVQVVVAGVGPVSNEVTITSFDLAGPSEHSSRGILLQLLPTDDGYTEVGEQQPPVIVPQIDIDPSMVDERFPAELEPIDTPSTSVPLRGWTDDEGPHR